MWNLLLRVKPKLLKTIIESNKPYLILSQLRNLGNQAPKNAKNLRSTLYYAAGEFTYQRSQDVFEMNRVAINQFQVLAF